MNAPTLAVLRISIMGTLLGLPLGVFGAQPPRQPEAGRLARAIDRLSVVGRVLYVAAHPDDENTRLLAWLANDQLVRTAYLSLTRGDGGQNLIGGELGIDLGIIRTQELLAARRVDGARQYFTRARDFGYSKSPQEALATWGKADVLADVVWVIRRFQPDVIITRFPTSGIDTHGHHTASAILAAEAVGLADDPGYHPEQVALVGTWKTRRLVQNKPMFGARPGEDLSGYLALDAGGYDPALGVSYGELAAESRSMHKSQGFGVARARGPAPEYFKLLAGEPMKQSLFDGIDRSWSRVPGAQKLAALLADAARQFEPAHPAKVLPLLAAAHAALQKLPASSLQTEKLEELAEVMVACAGLHLDATVAEPVVVPGGKLAVSVNAINRTSAAVKLEQLEFSDGTTEMLDKPLAMNASFNLQRVVDVAAATPIGNPYWLEAPPSPGLFTGRDQGLIGLPERPPTQWVRFQLALAGATVTVPREVFYQWVDPVQGERYRSVEVSPAITVTPATPLLLFANEKSHALRLRLKSAVADAQGEVRLELPKGFRAEPARAPFTLVARDSETELLFQIFPPKGATEGSLRAVVEIAGAKLSRGYAKIEYPHIPIQSRFPAAEVRLVRFALSHARTRIGYIAGAGDEVPAALRQVGYEVTLIGDEALRTESLTHYEAILTGIRAFNTNTRLSYLHDKLMAYVAGGGTLLVQYNTNNRLAKAPSEIGPYPFQISQDRVTDENAIMNLTAHPVFAAPNKLEDADFAGWVQERGLYFAGTWDKRYEAPLTMNDPGEPPKQGSLLIARHGKGTFIYTGLSFFRQLPAGVPGAFRLLANLIDHGR